MRGLTLIEMLVVLALFTAGIAIGGFVSFSLFQTRDAADDAATLSETLRIARARSMHEVCGSTACLEPAEHGVYVSKTGFTLFEGKSYASRDADFDEKTLFGKGTGTPAEIVFASGEGSTDADTAISLSFPNGTIRYLHINRSGGISESL